MADQTYETIIVEKERGRARITLNRPEKLNALSAQLQRELRDALLDADRDNRVHSVILRGAGRAFCAGYDLTPDRRLEGESANEDGYAEVYRHSQSFDDDVWRMEDAQRDRMTIFDMHKPVIGQLHGYCVAGGTDLILLCDIVVAARDAQIGFPPVRAMGGPPAHMWTYLVGPQWAKYMLLTGEFISGELAQEIVVIHESGIDVAGDHGFHDRCVFREHSRVVPDYSAQPGQRFQRRNHQPRAADVRYRHGRRTAPRSRCADNRRSPPPRIGGDYSPWLLGEPVPAGERFTAVDR